jgi:hypothetical protein
LSCNTTSHHQARCSATKPGAPFLEATVRYFSFFTYLTNILVALALTLPWISLALIGIDRRMGRSNEQAAGVAT